MLPFDFFGAEEVHCTETFERMLYRENCGMQGKVYQWVKRTAEQASLMKIVWEVHSLYRQVTMLKELVLWPSQIHMTSWILVLDLHAASFTVMSDITKFVQVKWHNTEKRSSFAS